MRVVLDTSILIAALITADTPPDIIYSAWKRKRFELASSNWQIDEFRRVSKYPKVKKFISPSEAGRMVNSIRIYATVYDNLPAVDLCRDPDDNPILAIALKSEADYLVTGDKKDLLSMKQVGTTKILSASEFLKLLGE